MKAAQLGAAQLRGVGCWYIRRGCRLSAVLSACRNQSPRRASSLSVHQVTQHTTVMTEAAAENTGEMDELQARQVEISALLKKRAPLMCPSVVPRAFKGALAGVQTFLASEAGKRSASAAVASAAAAAAAERREEGEEEEGIVDDDGGRHVHVVLTTETDIATRTFRITAAKVCMWASKD